MDVNEMDRTLTFCPECKKGYKRGTIHKCEYDDDSLFMPLTPIPAYDEDEELHRYLASLKGLNVQCDWCGEYFSGYQRILVNVGDQQFTVCGDSCVNDMNETLY